ncbi:MAG TPA: hypothetical protein VM529_05530 [Gemmata sp.]|nr:hypothetical protein [Gemmata sp.]
MTDDDFVPPSPRGAGGVSLSAGVAWGLVALLIGCTLLISACALMVFNVILFRGGIAGIPRELAQIGGLVAVIGVAAFGVLAVVFGFRGWNAASRSGEPTAFGVAGTLAAVVGFVGWAIAGIDLLAILGLFR